MRRLRIFLKGQCIIYLGNQQQTRGDVTSIHLILCNAVCTKTQGDAHARTRTKTRFELIILLISYTICVVGRVEGVPEAQD